MLPSQQHPLTLLAFQGQLVGHCQGLGICNLQTVSHLAGIPCGASHLLSNLGEGRGMTLEEASDEVWNNQGQTKGPGQHGYGKGPHLAYSCPVVLTFLAQKSGFFWMAQGLSATPL